MMNDYTVELIAKIIENRERIEAFVERTTTELFPVYYEFGSDEYFHQEGNTLTANVPHNTRVPKRDNLKENLIVMLSDVDRALNTLEPQERLSVLFFYNITEGKGKGRSKEYALDAIEKMAAYLNNDGQYVLD